MDALFPFLQSILGGFISGVLVLSVATFVIPPYLEYRKRPNLVITNRKTYDDTFNFAKAADGSWESSLALGIQNDGLTAQREWYWNLIMPKGLTARFHDPDAALPSPRNEILEDEDGNEWIRYMGKCQDVIYPGRNYLFPYRIELRSEAPGDSCAQKIYYFFGTESGTSPAKAADLGKGLKLSKKAFTGHLRSISVTSR